MAFWRLGPPRFAEVALNVASITTELRAQVAAFETWRATLVIQENLLGGEPVFPGSRLAVRHVGEMLLRGSATSEILEDYPYLSERDLEFACLYATAYPRIGRPRVSTAAR